MKWTLVSLTALLLALGLVLTLGLGDALAKKPPKPPPEPDPDPAIVYSALTGKRNDRTWKLFVMNADGTNKTVVLDSAGRGRIGGADWSPRGDQLVVTMGPGLYLIDPDGTNLTHLLTAAGLAGDGPVWSPGPVPRLGNDVECIAYTSQRANEPRYVYILPLDGSDPIRLPTPEGYVVREPTWSPSGSRLAFALKDYATNPPTDFWGLYDFVEETYAPKVVSGSLDGVSLEGAYALNPSWSKTNENEIAWAISPPGEVADGYDIWVLDMDGLPVRRVTHTPGIHHEYPSWSPDDAKLVVRSVYLGNGRGGETYDVFSSLDGSGRETIAEDMRWAPVWRR